MWQKAFLAVEKFFESNASTPRAFQSCIVTPMHANL